MDPSIWKS